MLFIYILSRLYILLILTLTPHMSLSTGHMARFNALNAPHVLQPRTHGALQRPLCPTCPSEPDTWRSSKPLCPTCPSDPDKWRTSTPFNSLHAPHVPQIRTHGALQCPICPICPSNPDTWRAWKVAQIYKGVAKGGAV